MIILNKTSMSNQEKEKDMFLRSRTYSSCKFTGNKLRSGREPIKLLFDRSNTVNFDALLKLYIRVV
jgi:hypothetical protein